MYSRGKSINPEKQEKLDNMAKQFTAGGKKKWVRYDEGALLYSMGIHSFMELAKEAKALLLAVITVQDWCDMLIEKIGAL